VHFNRKNSSLFAVNFVIFLEIEDKKEYYLKKTLCCFLWKAQTMQKLEL